ncbi:MAG: flagellar motor protein MotA [Alphaproteobacteria bacterium]|nr:flagellar motor protein MotA [Alphaproteobacteria bacterium]MDX5367955.1 flagellar motor protein MotA [Alphaproteobacteria bacterium]MDX5462808.1 flagellar motor protein MotA [Alphaproteobacteria bacterium]
MATLDARPSDVTRPTRFLVRMGIFLALVTLVVAALHREIIGIFSTNPVLNGLIIGTAVLGIVYILRQVFLLGRSTNWIEAYMEGRSGVDVIVPPSMLAPIAAMLRQNRSRGAFSALSMRSILDSLGARLEESREIARYLIGLLIFLGLLGTFWGLLSTIGAIVDTIRSLNVGSGDITSIFDDLKRGLEAPLDGMGTAFASSLLGLSGSLVLGFLDLQLGQAQNAFYNDLEEWLSGQTKIGGAAAVEGDHAMPAYMGALLERTAESLERMERTLEKAEAARVRSGDAVAKLAERLMALTEALQAEQGKLQALADRQDELKPALDRIANIAETRELAIDEVTRGHIRNVDVYVKRLLEENAAGRADMIDELRAEIRMLARTIAASAEKRG